jgi:type IV pilus assembly protein PilY1
LLRYVHGFQSIDADSADIWNVRDWVMADVLHSRPVVFNLSEYGAAEENLCAADVDLTNGEKYNSSYIFVGTNGGMLNAFRDCDGSEAWAYVPENNLDTLKYLPEDDHTSYVDSAPSIFYFDVNADGTIGSGDKAVLIVGQRRGGGKDTLDSTSERGSYYALDITDPENPTLLWEFSFDATSAPQLAETWALPKVGKIKVPDTEDEYRWLAFFSAGYDNNEDFRYGSTQLFSSAVDGSVSVSNAPTGGSVTGIYNGATLSLTSPADSTTGFEMRGKGLMAVEVGYSTRNLDGKFETVVDPSS